MKNSKASVESLFYEWLTAPLTEAELQEFSRLLDILYQRCKAESKAGFPEMQNIMKGGNQDGKK